MSDNRSSKSFEEGTQFYRKSAVVGVLKRAVMIFVIFLALSVLFGWAAIDAGARQAYKEARDVRRALRAVGTEYYAGGTSIYDPQSVTGLAHGAAEKVQQLSTRDGEVLLHSWDNESVIPLQFEYHKGMYRVIYTDAGTTEDYSAGTEGEYTVYYSFEILRFEAE